MWALRTGNSHCKAIHNGATTTRLSAFAQIHIIWPIYGENNLIVYMLCFHFYITGLWRQPAAAKAIAQSMCIIHSYMYYAWRDSTKVWHMQVWMSRGDWSTLRLSPRSIRVTQPAVRAGANVLTSNIACFSFTTGRLQRSVQTIAQWTVGHRSDRALRLSL